MHSFYEKLIGSRIALLNNDIANKKASQITPILRYRSLGFIAFELMKLYSSYYLGLRWLIVLNLKGFWRSHEVHHKCGNISEVVQHKDIVTMED